MTQKRSIVLIIGFVLISISISAQKNKYQKENFKVWGNCEMCKTTIEKAIKAVDGVKIARWNIANREMKVKFNREKTNIDYIHKAITNVGYDTELYKASDESYNKLHYCCKYERE